MRDDMPVEGTVYEWRERAWYARLLSWSGWTSLALLTVGFVVFLVELLPPFIHFHLLPEAWALSAQELGHRHGHPSGWQWLQMLGHGDILNLLGIALLASSSLIPLAAVAVIYWRGHERLYSLFAVAQMLVLLAAASGLLTTGH